MEQLETEFLTAGMDSEKNDFAIYRYFSYWTGMGSHGINLFRPEYFGLNIRKG